MAFTHSEELDMSTNLVAAAEEEEAAMATTTAEVFSSQENALHKDLIERLLNNGNDSHTYSSLELSELLCHTITSQEAENQSSSSLGYFNSTHDVQPFNDTSLDFNITRRLCPRDWDGLRW